MSDSLTKRQELVAVVAATLAAPYVSPPANVEVYDRYIRAAQMLIDRVKVQTR